MASYASSFHFGNTVYLLAFAMLFFSAPPIPATGILESPAAEAKGTLKTLVQEEQSWSRIHAAETLIAEGEREWVRHRFEATADADSRAPWRVGALRVLATAVIGKEERAHYTNAITRLVLDASAPDRKQAIETLGKLRHPVEDAALEEVRRLATPPISAETVIPVWALCVAGDKAALGTLVDGLKAEDPLVRQRCAYSLRWLRAESPVVKTALADAASREPAGTRAHLFIVSSAFALHAKAERQEEWKAILRHALFHAPAPERFEAAQTLAPFIDEEDLPAIAKLLESNEPGTQVAAAIVILSHARHPAIGLQK